MMNKKCLFCGRDMGSEWVDTCGEDGNEDVLLYTCDFCGYKRVALSERPKMREDFSHLDICVTVKEVPSLDGLLCMQKMSIAKEALKYDGMKIVEKAISKSVVAVLRKKLSADKGCGQND